MASKPTLRAEKRKLQGRKVKRLRKEGILPANIYGKKVKSLSVQVPLQDFDKVYKEVGETGLLQVLVENKKRSVLIHNVQVDPVTGFPLHVDFFQVDLTQKVSANVPIETTGGAPAEKQGLGTVVTQLDEIEVEALPADLPEKFTVDLSELKEVDQAIYIKDLSVNKAKVTIKDDLEAIVVKVEPLRKEEEVPEVIEEEEEEGEEVEKEEGKDESKEEEIEGKDEKESKDGESEAKKE